MGGAVGAGQAEDGLEETEESGVDLGAVGGGLFAISADDAAAGGGEVGGGALIHHAAAADAGEEFGQVAALAQQIELEGEEGFFALRGGKLGDRAFEAVEELGVGVVFLDQAGDQLGGVEAEVDAAQVLAEGEVALAEAPLGERGKILGGVVGEDGLAEVQ